MIGERHGRGLRSGAAAFVAACWLAVVAGSAQEYQPAAELTHLLNMRFYDQSGGFMVEQLELVFPPAGDQPAELVLATGAGQPVETVPLSIRRWEGFPAFAGLVAKGHPGIVHPRREGDFVLAVRVGGATVTSLPYSVKAVSSGDPFNPQTGYVREGPWRSLAYLALPVANPGDALTLNWWGSTRETPGGKGGARCSVRLKSGSTVVAESSSVSVVSAADWQPLRARLVTPAAAGGKNFTMADLTARDGAYAISIESDGAPVKTFTAHVKGGALQRLDRCRLDVQPHSSFISPRLVDTSSGSNSSYSQVDAYWVSSEAR